MCMCVLLTMLISEIIKERKERGLVSAHVEPSSAFPWLCSRVMPTLSVVPEASKCGQGGAGWSTGRMQAWLPSSSSPRADVALH